MPSRTSSRRFGDFVIPDARQRDPESRCVYWSRHQVRDPIRDVAQREGEIRGRQAQGAVAKSTHAGIPWLMRIRESCGEAVHFWPFDGWSPPAGKTVIAEIYPSIFRNRYDKKGRTAVIALNNYVIAVLKNFVIGLPSGRVYRGFVAALAAAAARRRRLGWSTPSVGV